MVKVLKIGFGLLASLFALLHVFALIGMLINGSDTAETFAASAYMGHVVGIAVGLLIAVLCFRGKKSAAADELDMAPETANSSDALKEEGRLSF